jgi:putative endonuclease
MGAPLVKIVIAGLDPAIHHLRKTPSKKDGCAGLRLAEGASAPQAGHARADAVGMNYWVYILASAPGGTLYVGMTNNLVRRVYEHREGFVRGFTRRYGVKRLVYFEAHDTALAALQREKNIKHWPREWKIDLIVRDNPTWRDLYDEIVC